MKSFTIQDYLEMEKENILPGSLYAPVASTVPKDGKSGAQANTGRVPLRDITNLHNSPPRRFEPYTGRRQVRQPQTHSFASSSSVFLF